MRIETEFDVVATNIKTGAKRYLALSKSEKTAEAIVAMAVMRRGVEEELFKAVPAGAYGDETPPPQEPT